MRRRPACRAVAGVQLVADARERSVVARLADVRSVLAVDGSGLLVVAVPDAVRAGSDGSTIPSGVDADTGEVR